jgi:N utilization substance protein A
MNEEDTVYAAAEVSPEVADGRCHALTVGGKRCPNAALEGSLYCGIPSHQALADDRK